MDLIIFTLYALCSAAAIFFFLLSTMKLITTRSSKNKPRIKLPPGPRKLPIIGNLHQLYGHLPQHILYHLAKKHGPLMHLQFGEVSTIVVSSPEIAKEIFKTQDTNFSHRPTNFLFSKALSYDFSDMMYEPYGTFWREMRKLVAMKLLSTKRVQSFRGIREEEVMNLMRSIFLLKGSCINLSKVISSLLSTITGRAAFGNKNQEDLEKYILLLDQLFSLGSGFQISDMYPSIKFLQIITGTKRMLESVSEEMYKIVENIWREHKEKKFAIDDDMMEDFVDDLLNIQNAAGDLGVPFTDKNLKAIIFNILNGASDTSSIIIEWAMSEMIRHPSRMKRAQDEVRNVYGNKGNVDESKLDELKYLKAVVKETLRLHPSVPLLVPRECKERCKINGYDIPAKTRVLVNAWAIGRVPSHWKEPEQFKPERFLESNIEYRGTNFAYIPFGAGKRICPGISFAEPNMLLPLAQLLFHFDWKLPGKMKPEELDMDESIGLVTPRKNELMVIPLSYSGSFLENHVVGSIK